MKIVFATNNAHKLSEVQAVLGDAFTLLTPRDCGVEEDIPEEQQTLEGNASQKSHYLHGRTGLDCFADDTGLEVEALGGAPGVHSARYATDGHDFAANNRLLLKNLEGAENRRALPYFLKVEELLDSGAIGEVLSVEVRYFRPESPGDRDPARLPWRLRREVGGEGYFCDMAPHTLDILDFLLGEIADARGCKTNRGGFYDVADTVAASFRFRSGVPGTGMWCFVAPPSAAEDSVVVTGRKGSVRFSTFDFTPVELVTARGVERFEIAPPEHIQGPLIETIVRELRGEGVCPSTGVSAARTSRVMDEIMKE